MDADTDKLVSIELRKLRDVATANGWELVARWSDNKVKFGCKLCIEMLAAGRIQMQNRHKNNHQSNCFAHFNKSCNLRQAIAKHHEGKIHQQAESIQNSSDDADKNVLSSKFGSLEERKQWRNATFLALQDLIKFKSHEDFVEDICDATDMGAELHPGKWRSKKYYKSVLKLADRVETATLTSEISKSMVFNVLILGGEMDENCQTIRCYFITETKPRKYELATRILDVATLQSVNHKSIVERIKSVLGAVGQDLQLLTCWVATCCSMNGIGDSHVFISDKFWALLSSEVKPMCGRFWGTYKLFNLCLKSQWQHADTKDFLAELEEYVLKVVCRENTTQQMEDKIASLCDLVKRYKDWIVICHQRSIRKDCGDVKK